MATAKEAFGKSVAAIVSGVMAGGLAYLVKDVEFARDTISHLTSLKDRGVLDGIAAIFGMYSVGATLGGLVGLTVITPYYKFRSYITPEERPHHEEPQPIPPTAHEEHH